MVLMVVGIFTGLYTSSSEDLLMATATLRQQSQHCSLRCWEGTQLFMALASISISSSLLTLIFEATATAATARATAKVLALPSFVRRAE